MNGAGTPATRWHPLAASRTGANHVRTGRPNQDAALVWSPNAAAGGTTTADTIVLAVADGHGSAAHPRSDTGARLAVETFRELAELFCAAHANDESLRILKAVAEEEFPRQLVRQWRAAVTRHAAEASDRADPPTAPDSVHSAEAAAADGGPHAVATDVTTPYGATLIGVVVTPGLLVCWQLGDGDIVLVDQGRNASCPLAPERPRLGVETESLCQPDAWSHVRVHWRPLTGAPPALVLLSTDGLSDSYADRPGFEGFAVDMLDRIRSEGAAAVQEQIVGWLGKAAEFSGDDATVAAAWRVPEGSS